MWMKIDDRLHAHRKTRNVTRTHPKKTRDASPMGLWVLAGSWASQNATDGWVPEAELDRWDDEWEAQAKRLVRAGYWWPEDHDGEPGFGFNDWQEWNSPAASDSGIFGNHVRWHVKKGVVKEDCEHCPKEPDEPEVPESPTSGASRPDIAPDRRPDIGSGIAPNRLPVPVPTRPVPVNPSSPTADAAPDKLREDVSRLCEHLANRIAAHGVKRPVIGKGWHDAARLMLDRDGIEEPEIHWLIDKAHDDEFWRGNILSMPTLRSKASALRIKWGPFKPAQVRNLPNARDIEQPPDGLSDAEYHAWYVAQAEKRRRA